MLAIHSVEISDQRKESKSNRESNVLMHYWEGQEPIIIKKSISMKRDRNKKPLISCNYRFKKRMR